VTGVDFTPKALDKARAKARTADAAVDFVHADVTHLSQAGISGPFELIVDNGCMHGMSDHDRDLYVEQITAAAAPGARLAIVGFKRGGGVGPVGIDQAEIERRFRAGWTLLSAADERVVPQGRLAGKFPARLDARSYLLQRNA
jgi:SAM-dependent methyltransferase